MGKTRGLQTHFQICYWIIGEKLSPDRVNPLIAKFSGMLRDFKIEEKDYRAIVSRCEDSIFEEVDTRKIKVSSHLTFDVADSRPSNDINKWGLSHEEGAAIHRGLRKISLIDVIYSHKVSFTVQDSVQGSEPPMSRPNSQWPMQRF